MNAPIHIAVVGGSGSGKTWLAEKLVTRIKPNAARLSLDDFYRDLSSLPIAERNTINFDDPATIDWELFGEVLDGMRVGEDLHLPSYDFALHTRKADSRNFQPPAMIIWDGLWLLHHARHRQKYALTIFVECDPQERLRRRIERDMLERSRTMESVYRQFYEQVEPMHQRYVEPQRELVKHRLFSPTSMAECSHLVVKLLDLFPN